MTVDVYVYMYECFMIRFVGVYVFSCVEVKLYTCLSVHVLGFRCMGVHVWRGVCVKKCSCVDLSICRSLDV